MEVTIEGSTIKINGNLLEIDNGVVDFLIPDWTFFSKPARGLLASAPTA